MWSLIFYIFLDFLFFGIIIAICVFVFGGYFNKVVTSNVKPKQEKTEMETREDIRLKAKEDALARMKYKSFSKMVMLYSGYCEFCNTFPSRDSDGKCASCGGSYFVDEDA